MSYCLNPSCAKPQNPNINKFCHTCGSQLLLAERYRAIRPIGQGGFGRTLLAEDEYKPSKPLCVIKQFYSQNQININQATELFKKEALRLDHLGKHPQIPELFAYFEQDERLYIVQEFIDGQNLAQELSQGEVFKEYQIQALLNDLLPVLQFIHKGNIIHRDIKPENIIRRRSDKKLFLVDFGAAKFATATILAQTGTVIGTPEYIAPEQLRGRTDFASDIYSLGVTCLNLLTKMSPFELFDAYEGSWKWREYIINNFISEKLANILDKMVQIAIKQRYQSGDEVLADLNSKTITIKSPDNISDPCFRTLSGHLNYIKSVAFSPDGKILASGSKDNTVKLWDITTGVEMRSFKGNFSSVRSVAFSPDGKTLAIGGRNNRINLWSLSTGNEICQFCGHSHLIRSVTFSPDGKTLASASQDKTFKLWDVSTGREIMSLQGHTSGLYSLVFSTDGKILASGSGDKTIKLWDVRAGLEMNTFSGHSGMVRSVAFSPDGKTLASGSWDNTVKLWDVSTKREICTFISHSNHVFSVAFSPDGKTLASGSWDKTIKLWDVNTQKEITTFKGHSDYVLSVAFSPDGKTLATGGNDKRIKLWRCG